MSRGKIIYPQTTDRDALPDLCARQAREEEENCAEGDPLLPDYADIINAKLRKAEAVAWLINSTGACPDQCAAAGLISDLLRDARTAYNVQWEKIQHSQAREAQSRASSTRSG